MGYEEYYNKVYGGWLGKCIGGAAGAPVEGIKKIIPCDDFRKMMQPDVPNDDLDIQLLWLEVIQEKGLSFTAKDLADAWNKHCWYPFNEYGIFLKNYDRGIYPPESGRFNNPLFSSSEGCPIRSEIWGMIFPCDANKAAYYAGIDGSLDHCDEAVWIEQYYAAIESEGFVESNIEYLIKKNMRFLPNDSKAYKCVQLIIDLYRNESNWLIARERMLQEFGHNDFTNAVTNLGIVLIAVLYGKKSIYDIINIAFQCGYDTDCTCATAGAIWGICNGATCISEEIKALVGDEFVTGIELKRTNNTITKLSEEICELGLGLMNARENVFVNPVYSINYYEKPSIGINDTCKIGIEIDNSTERNLELKVYISDCPEGWVVVPKEKSIDVKPNSKATVDFIVKTSEELKVIKASNILRYVVEDGNNTISDKFGIAGASEWEVIGPYFENLEKEDPKGWPLAHGENSILPTLECMVNNAVYLNKQYINENALDDEFQHKRGKIIHAYEDMIPLNDTFSFTGQGCIYLRQNVISPKDQDVWVVIGNNDGLKVWINDNLVIEKDEIRLWTPYNNYYIVSLKKGLNSIVIKYLKRTENMMLSFAFRKYEGMHFHRKRWCVDLDSSLL